MKAISAVSAKVWLLHLNRIAKESLSLNVIREVCSYLADLELAQVTAAFLRFLNTQTSIWGPQISLSTPIQANTYSSWVILDDGRLFCSGGCASLGQLGEKAQKEAYLLSRTGTVTQLPSMLSVRFGHGLIQVQCLFAFGGSKS